MWHIIKVDAAEFPRKRHGKPIVLPPGTYTLLLRLTDSTLHQNPPGETVMEDTPYELQTHLNFVIRASGRVLVTGLGLGCVVRGLLKNPVVEHVTCIENSPDVLQLVAPHMPKDRLTLVEADARSWTASNQDNFDCAWHDLWTNQDGGEPHLNYWHSEVLLNCRKTVRRQGAWKFDRTLKRYLVAQGFNWIG